MSPGNSKPQADRSDAAGAVVLIGFMGAGKSSVGQALSKQLGWTFEDLDERIERREQRRVADIFRESSEAEFRGAEHAALMELLSELRAGVRCVVALGGGAMAQDNNARLLQAAGVPTVFLDADVEELWRRCRRQALEQRTERPLLTNMESFCDLYRARRPFYMKATFQQETVGKSIEEIAAELVQLLGLNQGRQRRGRN